MKINFDDTEVMLLKWNEIFHEFRANATAAHMILTSENTEKDFSFIMGLLEAFTLWMLLGISTKRF